MSQFIKKYIFLFIAIAAFVSAWGFFYAKKESTGSKTYAGVVRNNLRNEILRAERDIDEIMSHVPVSGNKPFSALLIESPNPYYLYKDSVLLMWSDYRYAIGYSLLSGRSSGMRTLATPQGKFVIVKEIRKVGDSTYELFMLIELQSANQADRNETTQYYNLRIFEVEPKALSISKVDSYELVADSAGRAFFYVSPPNDWVDKSTQAPIQSLVLLAIALLFLIMFGMRMVLHWRHRRRYRVGLGLLLFFVIGLAVFMWYFSIPFAYTRSPIFDPNSYEGDPFSPSLGALLLNCLGLLWVIFYINRHYFRTVTYRRLMASAPGFRYLVAILILLGSHITYYLYYRELITLCSAALYTLDITLSISFSPIKITALAAFVGLSGLYFMINQLIFTVYIRLTPTLRMGGTLLVLSVLVVMLLAWVVGVELEWIFLAHIAYIFTLYFTRLPRSFYGFRYPTTVYYFLTALMCSLTTTCVIQSQESIRDLADKKEFGSQFISRNDALIEVLLKKDAELVARDQEVKELLVASAPLAREMIQQRIRSKYLDEYQDAYAVEVLAFDGAGNSLDNSILAQPFDFYVRAFAQPAYATALRGIFILDISANTLESDIDTLSVPTPSSSPIKQYSAFVTVGEQSVPDGYLILKLSQKSQTALNPGYLPDERFIKYPEIQEYSYAIFENGKQMYSSGPYNYERRFPSTTLLDSTLYRTGLELYDYKHVGLVGIYNRQIVVSAKSWGWNGFWANFSFLYLILVVVVSLIVIGYALHSGIDLLPLTYATKIQVLLNASFIIPLLIVLFFILQIIHSNYRENQENAHLRNTKNLSVNVLGYMDEYSKGIVSKGYFEQQIQRIARDSDLDINIYENSGRILMASKPLLHQGGLVSELINPVVMKQIIEQKEKQLLLPESLGKRTYNTAYICLKSTEQKPLGVLSVSQYDAKSILDRQIIDIVSSVLIVFTIMLISFLLISYLAANLLIEPLRTLARKISSTNLDQLNSPLPWHSNDEIGVLIKKYNQMLVNLELNKQALSSNEKQSAWREMARQVAHEIKNPLTPMKLTIQQLQRTIRRDDPEALEKVNRAMDSIIKQIDTIGYIAQSFSDIAKMPPPQNEVFEVTAVVNKAYELYSNDETVTFHQHIASGPLYVSGDRQQFGGSISNLIINARQSVPASRGAEITVRLYTHNKTVIVEVQDNGTGIPQNIRSRVFLPNFTTREGGTGLGLAMAKRIIEYAGGSIWFETEDDKGTTFFLSLPWVEGNKSAHLQQIAHF